MTTPVNRAVGVKGSDVYDSTGSLHVDLNLKLVRGADAKDIESRVLALARGSLEDAWVFAFKTRNIRGGAGERDLFKDMFLALNKGYPELARAMLKHVPDFGSWDDVFKLASNTDDYGNLREAAIPQTIAQLKADAATPEKSAEGKVNSISLCAKWAPRETKMKALAQQLAFEMFPELPTYSARMGAYRKLVAGLNRRLKTVETLMSAGEWDKIAPASVPGRAGKVYARAFLNLPSAKKEQGRGEAEQLRRPDDAARMACRENFLAHFARAKEGKAKVHGADTLFPHEIVRKAYEGRGTLTEGEKDQLRAVWRSTVEKARGLGGLGRSIFMSDFSGSMQSTSQGDTPYWVSMALGLLGAETVTDPAFRDRFMTFDSTPKWHELPAASPDGSTGDIFDRLDSISGSIGQGTSTDFQAAMDLVLDTLKRQRVRPGEEPENLIVLTDMNWDQACGSSGYGYWSGAAYRHHYKHKPWETHVEMIRESFRRAGEDMWGSADSGGLGGWKVPRIVVWNLSANPADAPATADTPGVAMLSGWSPAQFKILCEAGPRQLTAYEILRIELDSPAYEPIRQTVRAHLAATGKSGALVGGAIAVCDAPGEDCAACSGGAWGGGHADGWGAEEV